MYPAIRTVRKGSATQNVLLGNFLQKVSAATQDSCMQVDSQQEYPQILQLTANHVTLLDHRLQELLTQPLYNFAPSPLLTVCVMKKEHFKGLEQD